MAKITRTLRVAEATKLTLTALVFTAMLMLGTPTLKDSEKISENEKSESTRISARENKNDDQADVDEFEVVFIDDLNRKLKVTLDPNTGVVKHIDDTDLT